MFIQKNFVCIDHPFHDTSILGGMWGFYNSRNRALANQIFSKMIELSTSKLYNSNTNAKQMDQAFLSAYLYPLVKTDSTIHDSYLCEKYNESRPFPTRRQGGCFVGQNVQYGALECEKKRMDRLCPEKCRPQEHQDWWYC